MSTGKKVKKGRKRPSVTKATHDIQVSLGKRAKVVDKMLAEVERHLPSVSKEQLQRLGQALFTKLAFENLDTQRWIQVQRLELQRDQFELAKVKFEESLRGKFAAGVAALAQSIKGNHKAEQAFEQLRKLISEAGQGAAGDCSATNEHSSDNENGKETGV